MLHMPMDVSKAEVAPLETEREFLVIDSQLMQQGGM